MATTSEVNVRTPIYPILISLGLTLACGGGADTKAPLASDPTWSSPVDVAGPGYSAGGSFMGDGKGGVVAVWTRSTLAAGGSTLQEQVAAHLVTTRTWGTPQVLEAGATGQTLQPPVVAVDGRGQGQVLWFQGYPGGGSPVTELRTLKVDLSSATPFGVSSKAFQFPTSNHQGLQLAVGSDGSALAAWGCQKISATGGVTYAPVQVSRMSPGGVWGTPGEYFIPAGAPTQQVLLGVAGDGLGGFLMEMASGDDVLLHAEGVAFQAVSGIASGQAGWEPAAQLDDPAHSTAWATDGQGSLEAWLRYQRNLVGGTDTTLEAWPRIRSANGTWTMGDKVVLPRPANSLAVFREASGSGWLAGLGSQGLWVAPLNGLSLGTPKVVLPLPTTTEVMVGARDASGRPALLWIQRGAGGVYEGIGFSRWDGAAWTAPSILPGTAGKAIQRLCAVTGPAGLVAGWVEVGDQGLFLRAAHWM